VAVSAEAVPGDRATDADERLGRRLAVVLIGIETVWLSAIGYGLALLLA